jgi:hypothetical protein
MKFYHVSEKAWYSKSYYGIRKKLAVSFNHTFRYIDDVLSNTNHNFHKHVYLIYPYELEIKDITESDKSASYLNFGNFFGWRRKLFVGLVSSPTPFNLLSTPMQSALSYFKTFTAYTPYNYWPLLSFNATWFTTQSPTFIDQEWRVSETRLSWESLLLLYKISS